MASTLQIVDDDEFDWEAAVQEIDLACQKAAAEQPTSISNPNSNFNYCNPRTDVEEKKQKRGKIDVSSTRQYTLDRFFLGSSSSSTSAKAEFSNGLNGDSGNGNSTGDENGSGVAAEWEDTGVVKIDVEAAKTWIYPENFPHRDYQFSITSTALFSNTLVVLPTGLGKTLIAAVVMYNFFRWFPEGKIVFAAPSRPLVMQQIEACHKIVGIPQEWTIDLTGQMSPNKRAEFWKNRRVFFVTPQVLEKDIHSGSCLVKHLVCLVIDEAHHANGNYAYCVAIRELMDTHVQIRILALTATPGYKKLKIQDIIDNLQISTIEYRNESDPDVRDFVHKTEKELIEVAMGNEASEIDNMILEVVRPLFGRLSAYGVIQKRDIQTLSPFDLVGLRNEFRQQPPPNLPHTKYGEIEGYFGVLVTLYHVRKLLSSHGIRPAFEMLDEKLKEGYLARLMSRNEVLLKAKLLMQQTLSHGAPSPKLAKMLEVLIDHFKVKDPETSRVIIFSSFRGSVRDILDALTNIGNIVRATEFIGQSSGKASKGQSQKVQQAVLQKFRTGGYNVIVATSIGEEGLDIMEVDLVICFDANVSPLRMIQRMGRTGRKREGRVVVLACEGPELKAYRSKQKKSKDIEKDMRNGRTKGFNFHPSPRMVPHVFKPEVKFVKMDIEEFVPRGKKVNDFNPLSLPAYKTELTNAETDLLAKYFASTGQISWKPSLISFPHFQAFPSPINKVLHSSRTGILIGTMQYLQGLTFANDSKTFSAEDEDISDTCLRVEAMVPHEEVIEERSSELNEELLETDEKIAEEMLIEDLHKQKPCIHALLFGSEFVSVDDVGNVVILSLPQLPLESNAKCIDGSSMASVCHLMLDSKYYEENTVQAKYDRSSPSRSPDFKNLLDASIRSPDVQNQSPGVEEIFHTPVSSRIPKETDFSGKDRNIVQDRTPTPLHNESSNDCGDYELSPRLTNFIKSGVVPESPVNDSGPWNGNESNSTVPALVSSRNLLTKLSKNSWKHDEKENQNGSWSKMDVPCATDNDIQAPIHNAQRACTSPNPIPKEMLTPLVKLSNSSNSKDWLLDSGGKPETVEQPRKFRRLRKLGDLNRKVPSESKERTRLSRKLRTSGGIDHHRPSEKKRPKDGAVYIEEEAEESDFMSSDDEEDEHDNSSYEDSFIDDGVNHTPANTQAGVGRPDMMAIYRRSLLSQSPFPRFPPDYATNFSPNSTCQSSRTDESGSSSIKHDVTPQTGLDSTAKKNSQSTCNEIPSAMVESQLDSRKRKLNSYNAQTVPMVNLDKEFSLLSEENPSLKKQVDRTEEDINFIDDDQFFEGIDLDALEEEAAKLLRQKTTTLSEPIPHNPEVLEAPSFDLGF